MAISSHPGHLLVFDCEGGNNAMSKSHSIVTVARASTKTTLFVTRKERQGSTSMKQHGLWSHTVFWRVASAVVAVFYLRLEHFLPLHWSSSQMGKRQKLPLKP